MNIGATVCLILAGAFLLLGLIFWLLGEKAAMLVSGFNTLPKEKRESYDQLRLSADHRNLFFLWSGMFAAGAAGSFLISQYTAVAVFAIWLILFFREVHINEEKAFSKYLK